jgi:saccharopine dehydrogenase-like NADP-dependent oxidoreductase
VGSAPQTPARALSLSLASLEADAAITATACHRYKRVTAAHIDVTDNAALDAAIAEHDLVVSLVPWKLHPDVARACINRKVNMVTTSYVSPAMEEMHDDAVAAGVTILNEIGLDPGIDHLGAMRVIDDVKDRGGRIKSFVSFCGGLPAAEASFVPLQYKFSWSPKGVLLAGLSQVDQISTNPLPCSFSPPPPTPFMPTVHTRSDGL